VQRLTAAAEKKPLAVAGEGCRRPPARQQAQDGRALLDLQRLHRLRQRVDGFLVLAGFVQRFAFGPLFLHFRELVRGERRVLRERLVDLLHVRGAMERKRRGARERQRAEQSNSTNLHGDTPVVGWDAGRP
jgi:hypothetical protein